MNIEYRQIKFRVWNDKTKNWIHGPHEMPSLDGVNLFGETILLGGFMNRVSIEDLNDCVALQFTGLKDKNGKEIFEGDIVRWIVRPLDLRYKEEFEEWEHQGKPLQEIKKMVQFKHHGFMCFDSSGFGPYRAIECEVIGNIFENLELLK